MRAQKVGAGAHWLALGLLMAAGHPCFAGSWENVQREFFPSLLLGKEKKEENKLLELAKGFLLHH